MSRYKLAYTEEGRCFMCHECFIPENEFHITCSAHCRSRFRMNTRMTVENLYNNIFPKDKSELMNSMDHCLEVAAWNSHLDSVEK